MTGCTQDEQILPSEQGDGDSPAWDLGTIYRKSTTNTGDKRNAENTQKHRVYAGFRRFLIPQYDVYWIIDFDEGYVYTFCDGNGDTTCDRLKIDSGNLNDGLIITYHDYDDIWSYGLHFKWRNQPDHLVLLDNDGFELDFYPTSFENALAARQSKTIHDY